MNTIEKNTLELAQDLIQLPSVTPEDGGCQTLLAHRLKAIGFTVEHLKFGQVDNLWARRGSAAPLFLFLGHTDVVPPGDLACWRHPPFSGVIEEGFLYGRGSADMKSAIAAMMTACERFIAAYPEHEGSLAFLITSDEEGAAKDGTRRVMEYLLARGESFNWCVVGEPSSEHLLGDTLKIGRRGSLSGHICVHGKQGHVAYPHLADNPIHRAFSAFSALCQETWDVGDAVFPPTSLQFSSIQSGVGIASNVIPGTLEATFNFRYTPQVSAHLLQHRVEKILQDHGLRYELTWNLSGLPFLTQEGKLVEAVKSAVHEITGLQPSLSTGGGTSDGRFVAPTGCQVVELGVCHATIHQLNERVEIKEVILLSQIYERILLKLLRQSHSTS